MAHDRFTLFFCLLILLLPLLGGGNYLFSLSPVLGITIIHLATLFLLLSWSLQGISLGKSISQFRYIAIPVLSFAFINIVSLFYTVNPFNGHQKILILLNGIILYLLVQALSKDEEDLKRIIKIMVVSGIAASLYGIYQRFSGIDRIFSTFQNVNAFAGFLIILIPLSFYLALFSKERITKLWSGTSFLLFLSAFILTLSKGGMLTLILLSIIIMIYIAYNKIEKRYILILPPILALIFVYLLIRYSEINIIDSIKDRFEYWRITARIIVDHPIIGAGLGGYAAMAQEYQAGSVYSRYAHNNYLQIFAELGVFGFITYVWLVLNPILRGFSIIRKDRSKQHKVFFLMAAIGGFLIHTLIDFDWDVPAIQMTFFLLSGIITKMNKMESKSIIETHMTCRSRRMMKIHLYPPFSKGEITDFPLLAKDIQIIIPPLAKGGEGGFEREFSSEKEKAQDVIPGPGKWASYMILTLVIAISMIAIIAPFIADGYFHSAKKASNEGDVDLAIEFSKETVRFAPYSGRYHNLLAVMLRWKGGLTKDPLWYDRSLVESEKAIGYEPAAALYHNEKAKTLWQLNRREDSVAEFIKAKEIYPADISFRNDLGKAMIMLLKYDDAVRELESAILLGGEYIKRSHPDMVYLFDTYMLLGEGYEGKGETERSLNAYGEIVRLLSITPPLSDRDGNLTDKKQIEGMAHLRMGEIHQSKGDKDLAIQEFKKAFEMNRSLKDIPIRIKELEED
ncbi:MAG: O-antigen ligase family protein [Nitrospirae bacterium]|nr:O-antigen ligase family protein [Nitrospirota bacterium]